MQVLYRRAFINIKSTQIYDSTIRCSVNNRLWLLQIVENHPEWPLYQDFFNHPPPRLTSRKPIWSDLSPADTSSQWRDEWQSVSVANKNLISEPTTRLPGFNLGRSVWSMLNRFDTGQGRCAANLHRSDQIMLFSTD